MTGLIFWCLFFLIYRINSKITISLNSRKKPCEKSLSCNALLSIKPNMDQAVELTKCVTMANY